MRNYVALKARLIVGTNSNSSTVMFHCVGVDEDQLDANIETEIAYFNQVTPPPDFWTWQQDTAVEDLYWKLNEENLMEILQYFLGASDQTPLETAIFGDAEHDRWPMFTSRSPKKTWSHGV